MCEYCDTRNTKEDLRGDSGILRDKDGYYIYAEFYQGEGIEIRDIKYCPMCGKQLTYEDYDVEVGDVIRWISESEGSFTKDALYGVIDIEIIGNSFHIAVLDDDECHHYLSEDFYLNNFRKEY